MGAWRMGAFDNDTACDWAYELEESSDLSVLDNTFEKVISVGSDYLEAPDAEEAIAAAEVVARMKGKWGERNAYTKTVDLWIETKHQTNNRYHRQGPLCYQTHQNCSIRVA